MSRRTESLSPDEDGFGPDALEAALEGVVPVSRETKALLGRYRALLEEWSGRLNLIGPKELARFWRRHALDSLQLIEHAPADARRWLDLGSGAGLPAIPIACALRDRPGFEIRLTEKSPKKCVFLRSAVEALGLPAKISQGDVNTLRPYPVETVTARAFAPLPRILETAIPFLEGGAVGLFLKGENVEAELAACDPFWTNRVCRLPSRSDPRGTVLKIEGADLG